MEILNEFFCLDCDELRPTPASLLNREVILDLSSEYPCPKCGNPISAKYFVKDYFGPQFKKRLKDLLAEADRKKK